MKTRSKVLGKYKNEQPLHSPASPHTFPYFYWWLAGIIGGYFIALTCLGFLHIFTYKADFDLVEFNNVFWALLHTGLPLIHVDTVAHLVNWFGGIHFSPIFYFLLPLYALWPSTYILLIIHCACLAITALPVAFTLRRLELSDKTILALIAMLLFNPFYFDAGLWEFHEVSLACPLIALAYWALIAKRKTIFLIALGLLLMTKEHFGLAVAGFGCLWWWHHRDGWFGFLIALCGVATFGIVLEVIMPRLNDGYGHFMLTKSGTMPRYAWITDDIGDIFFTLFSLLFAQTPNNTSGIVYLVALFFTVGFLPLLAPVYILPAVADLLVILFSAHFFPRSIAAYHSCGIIPVLIIAAGVGINRWKSHIPSWLPLYQFIILITLVGNVALFPKTKIAAYELTDKTPIVDFQVADKVKSLIGDNIVSAQSNIAFLLSSGESEIYSFPVNTDKSEFIVLYLQHPYKDPYYYVFGDTSYLPAHVHFKQVLNLLEKWPKWGIVLWEDNWLVLKRDTADQLPVRAKVIEQARTLITKGDTFRRSSADWTPFLP